MRPSMKTRLLGPLLLTALVACRGSTPPAESLSSPPSSQPTTTAPIPAKDTVPPAASTASPQPQPPPVQTDAAVLAPEAIAACEKPGSLENFGPSDRKQTLASPSASKLQELESDLRGQSWWEQATRAALQQLGGERSLKTDELIRVRIPAGQAVIVDVKAAVSPSEITMIPLVRGKPQGKLWGDLDLTREHWMVVVPQPGQRADELVVHVDAGAVVAKTVAAHLAANGRSISFPPDLAFGQEPLGRRPNCGPERLYEFSKPVDSVRGAIELVRALYLEPESPLTRLKTCRISALPPRWNTPRSAADIDWERMSKRVQQRQVGGRTIYEMTYFVERCEPDSFVLRVSSDGWVGTYGCCGA